MKVGDNIIFIGKSNRNYKKYAIGKLICIYENSTIILVCIPKTNELLDIYDDDRTYARDKSLFCTLKELRTEKLEKINMI